MMNQRYWRNFRTSREPNYPCACTKFDVAILENRHPTKIDTLPSPPLDPSAQTTIQCFGLLATGTPLNITDTTLLRSSQLRSHRPTIVSPKGPLCHHSSNQVIAKYYVPQLTSMLYHPVQQHCDRQTALLSNE